MHSINSINAEIQVHFYTCKSRGHSLIYSPSHIAQITDFSDLLYENCKGKSGTSQNFILILSSLRRNIKIICGCAVVVKNQQKITCDRELSIVKSRGLKYRI